MSYLDCRYHSLIDSGTVILSSKSFIYDRFISKTLPVKFNWIYELVQL